jgi:hypothetical protein
MCIASGSNWGSLREGTDFLGIGVYLKLITMTHYFLYFLFVGAFTVTSNELNMLLIFILENLRLII